MSGSADVRSAAPAGRARPWLLRGLAVMLGLALGLGAAELLVRASGKRPWRTIQLRNELGLLRRETTLGWGLAPGRHDIAPYRAGAPDIHMTILPDGTRFTGAPAAGSETLLLLGCSFTQGWAVSDDETYAWFLQRRYPALRVVNGGVGGYGTYQSLLAMERALAAPDPPATILYGLMEEHEGRNVAAAAWLLMLSLRANSGAVAVPYATLDDAGRLVRHPPLGYPALPLREHSALVTALELWVTQQAAAPRVAQQRAVTQRLLREMQQTAARHGTRFAVVLLHFSPDAKAQYEQFMTRHGIAYVDCAYPLDATTRVPGDPHPNGVMHARYAQCIAGLLERSGWAAPPAAPRPAVTE